MSEDTSNNAAIVIPVTSSFDLDRYERERLENLRQRLPDLAQQLKAAGIVRIELTYDGCGDSGQIEDVAAFNSDGNIVNPQQLAEIGESELLELFYDLTQARHPGWENNDGAFGEFHWNLSTEELEHVHNDRFTDFETTEHKGL